MKDGTPTGRSLVTFQRSPQAAVQFQRLVTDLALRFTTIITDLDEASEGLLDLDPHYYEEYQIAVLPYAPADVRTLATTGQYGIQIVEEERFVRQTGIVPKHVLPAKALAASAQSTVATWGLKHCRVPPSTQTGLDIRIAVLDTGLDFSHPDFPSTRIADKVSFVRNTTAEDKTNGHGTHTTGTAAGPLTPASNVSRYGIAYQSKIYVGRVLNRAGYGVDKTIIDGIRWATKHDVHVVVMCFGGAVKVDTPVSECVERVAKDALAKGLLLVASAGNHRNGSVANFTPVNHPANCKSILAVAALTIDGNVATFSCGQQVGLGGEVNVAAPGEKIYSAIPGGYGETRGTSMAAAHAAGVAVLWCQKNGIRGWDLWRQLEHSAVRDARIDVPFSGRYVVAPA